MDLRVLRYFLTVVREKSIVRAADILHITQPTLSRQLKELEEEFGASLFVRGNRSQGITLTEKGMLLRQRAEQLVELADRTQAEMASDDTVIGGDIMIGCGESDTMRIVAATASSLQKKYKKIHYHLYSGNAENIKERLDKGLLDFGIFVDPTNLQKYESLRLPGFDRWGLLVRKDSPLAEKNTISLDELFQIPLIVSHQKSVTAEFEEWGGISEKQLNIVATYNLIYNASLMVEEGFGNAVCLDKLVYTGPGSKLHFIPLTPAIDVHLNIAWRKYQLMSKAAEVFLKELQERIPSVSVIKQGY